jgi:hypothetical protein
MGGSRDFREPRQAAWLVVRIGTGRAPGMKVGGLNYIISFSCFEGMKKTVCGG